MDHAACTHPISDSYACPDMSCISSCSGSGCMLKLPDASMIFTFDSQSPVWQACANCACLHVSGMSMSAEPARHAAQVKPLATACAASVCACAYACSSCSCDCVSDGDHSLRHLAAACSCTIKALMMLSCHQTQVAAERHGRQASRTCTSVAHHESKKQQRTLQFFPR